MAATVSLSLSEFKAGFISRDAIRGLVDERKKAIAQAIGEGVRKLLRGSSFMPKARKLSMPVAERMLRQLPRKLPLYAPNPAPNVPRVRISKSSKSPQNLSRPLFATDNPDSPNWVKVGSPRLKDPPVPGLMEKGGTKMSSSRRRVRKIGGGGEIDVDRGTVSRTGKVRLSKSSRNWTPAFPDDGSAVRVRYIRLRTSAQVLRSQSINDSLYRAPRPVVLRPRNYMQRAVRLVLADPATRRAVDRLYRDSVRKLSASSATGVAGRIGQTARRAA